jgi:two-component system, LytTR family, sensor kinase
MSTTAPALRDPSPPLSGWPAPLDRRLVRWSAGFAVWTIFGILSCAQAAVFISARPATAQADVDWSDVALDRMGDWYTCAVFTPFFFWVVRRYPLDRERWRSHASIQFAFVVACSIAKIALFHGYRLLLLPENVGRGLGRAIALSTITEVMAFWATLGVVLALEYYRQLREREAQAARLEVQLAEARLDALTSQLQPHFLFNTLHGVSTLMHRDVDAADSMLTRLADLLRRTLREESRHEVPIEEELELLRLYLGIMELRFRDRLSVSLDIDPAAHGALVPRLVLQPLVENALQHGIARRAGAGRVNVQAQRENGALLLRVQDDGPGSPADGFPREGIGLSNTRRRLRELYGDEQSLTLGGAPEGGLVVQLSIPFRRSK